jgi:hypothetical protein
MLARAMHRIQLQRFRFRTLLIERIMRVVVEVDQRIEDPTALIRLTAELDSDDLRIFLSVHS